MLSVGGMGLSLAAVLGVVVEPRVLGVGGMGLNLGNAVGVRSWVWEGWSME